MLSDALDVLGLAVLVATTYIGFGIVPAGFVLSVALLIASALFDRDSGRPEAAVNVLKAVLRQAVAQKRLSADAPLTNGQVDAELAKRG